MRGKKKKNKCNEGRVSHGQGSERLIKNKHISGKREYHTVKNNSSQLMKHVITINYGLKRPDIDLFVSVISGYFIVAVRIKPVSGTGFIRLKIPCKNNHIGC